MLGRRKFLKTAWWATLGLALGCQRSQPNSVQPSPPEFEFVLRNSRPLDLETPVEAFRHFLTPNDMFFVRSHHAEPTLDGAAWRLRVQDREFGLEELQKLENVTITAVLQCTGNGRGFYRPRVPGIPWERGAVGNAEWTGVPLARVLELAGIDPKGPDHVVFQGADKPMMDTVPVFARELPLAKCLHPDTLLAWQMNGQPLPRLHGGPVRLVVPGWYGEDWVKWITSIRVQATEYDGFYYKTGYRYNGQPMTEMLVRSLFSSPAQGSSVRGTTQLRGVAWSGGEAWVNKVEISDDEGKSWSVAQLQGEAKPYSWRHWLHEWTPSRSGKHSLWVRASDSSGKTQPLESSPWNPGGYLWNSVDRLEVTV